MAGDQAMGQVRLQNGGRAPSLPLELRVPVGDSDLRFAVPALAPGRTHEEVVAVPTRRRGVIALGPVSALRGDPLRLLSRSVAWGPRRLLLVHPPTVRMEPLGSGLLRDLEGVSTRDLSPSDVAFHTLREYVPGDDRRHVHWRTSARVGALMVRQFVDTRRSQLLVAVATDPSWYVDLEERELALSVAASMGLRAVADRHALVVSLGSTVVPVGTGQQMLDAFARFDPDARPASLAQAVAAAMRSGGGAGLAVLVVGSKADTAHIREGTRRLWPDAAVLVVRACTSDGAGPVSSMRRLAGLRTLDVYALGDLPRLLWAVREG